MSTKATETGVWNPQELVTDSSSETSIEGVGAEVQLPYPEATYWGVRTKFKLFGKIAAFIGFDTTAKSWDDGTTTWDQN